MLVLHTWPTTNGKKIPILLQETSLTYETHFVDIGRGEQFQPDFLAIKASKGVRQ